MAAEPLGPGAVYRRCSFADAPFETTDDLEPLGAPIAHDRAVRALHVATALRGTGSHFFALARELEDARRVTLELLTLDAASAPPAQDRCYVHDFASRAQRRAASPWGDAGRVLHRGAEGERGAEELSINWPEAPTSATRTRAISVTCVHRHGAPERLIDNS